jgi:tetratricopeptide (TPR) repeat protein
MKRWGTIGVMLLMALSSGVARAEDERVAAAKRHFEAGMASFHLEEYDKAIEEWEAGYRVKPAPQFLYNLAQAYRLSKRPEKALAFYQKYLALDPDATNRAEVERHIAALTALIQSQKQAAQRPATTPTAAVPTTTTGPASADLTATAPAREKPVYKKGWFWGVLVGGVVVAAGAVTLGVLLSQPASEQSLPVARF